MRSLSSNIKNVYSKKISNYFSIFFTYTVFLFILKIPFYRFTFWVLELLETSITDTRYFSRLPVTNSTTVLVERKYLLDVGIIEVQQILFLNSHAPLAQFSQMAEHATFSSRQSVAVAAVGHRERSDSCALHKGYKKKNKHILLRIFLSWKKKVSFWHRDTECSLRRERFSRYVCNNCDSVAEYWQCLR